MTEEPTSLSNEQPGRNTRKGFPVFLVAFAAAFVAAFLALHLVMAVLGGVDNTFAQFTNAARKGVGELVSGLFATGMIPVPFIAAAFSCSKASPSRKRIVGSVLASFIVESIWALPYAIGAHC